MMKHIGAISGGKDSVAMAVLLTEPVFGRRWDQTATRKAILLIRLAREKSLVERCA